MLRVFVLGMRVTSLLNRTLPDHVCDFVESREKTDLENRPERANAAFGRVLSKTRYFHRVLTAKQHRLKTHA